MIAELVAALGNLGTATGIRRHQHIDVVDTDDRVVHRLRDEYGSTFGWPAI
jgi:hypothetical protein